MPGYGVSADPEGLLPWSWAAERLAASRNYWVGSVRPGGAARPHVMPVWGVWLDDRFYFSTGRSSRKALNLAANPQCVVCTERASEAVIVEGEAEFEEGEEALRAAWESYKAKYGWDIAGEGMFVVTPRTAFGFIEHEEQFARAATRWRFG
jgi:nitroimidazol reductase NimA-like FMN-containing flavoprotein (pyridoxamine 5'-phosphate oxidase superfamily)